MLGDNNDRQIDQMQTDTSSHAPSVPPTKRTRRRRNAILLIVVAVVWLILDIVSKSIVNEYEVGQVIAGPFLDIARFTLVHNTGAAWGIFSDMTFILGIFSLVVCALIVVYLFVAAPRSSVGETFGLALVVAGGIGNALDRFIYGYVIDFIDPVFIDFPVFNLADTGVTCGVIIFIISLIVRWAREGSRKKEEAS